MPPKRPGGLKKSAGSNTPSASSEALAKKVKESKDAERVEDAEALDGEDTMQIALAETGNEIEEAAEMFKMALAKLDEGDDGVEEGAALLRGVVHESDRINRAHHSNNNSNTDHSTSIQPLPPQFHLTYGAALFRLGLLLAHAESDGDEPDNAEPIAYFDAAIDRFEIGIDAIENDEFAAWKLHEAVARAQIEKANLIFYSDETVPAKKIDEIVAQAVSHIEKALVALGDSDLDESISVISILVRHAQIRQLRDIKSSEKWINASRLELNKLLKADPNHIGALVALGQTYMTAANDLLERAEEHGEEVDLKAVEKLIDEALKHAEKGQKESDKKGKADVKLQLLLGEIFVNKANILDEAEKEEDADKFYKKAVSCFKQVQDLDASALPEAFDSFLQDWESEME
ncbi:hypothetical protein HDU99_001926 [Rhizoclosmatium hyalinum]|nr:hypothetical protein HDU99_001926 [Rhizoclosmatium hyalinum]